MSELVTSESSAPSPPPSSPLVSELGAYYVLVALYFFAFGLQFVLYPALAAFTLGESGARVGQALMALQAPMFALLLFGGLAAERVRAGPALMGLQLTFALPPLALAALIAGGGLSYGALISYGVAMGVLAAFMLPIRDRALNGVVEREMAAGRRASLATAATVVTAVQIAAQVLGILTGRMVESVGPAPLLLLQAATVTVAGVLALRLRAPKPESAGARTVKAAFSDIGAGLSYAFKDPVMGPMLASSAYVGVFIIGAFQVLFPLIVRDSYGGGPDMVGALYATFWTASFVAAATLGRLAPLAKPGRALLACQMFGGIALLSFALPKPAWAFFAVTALWGLAAGVSIAMSRTITQSATAPAFLGRVLAVYSMGFMGGGALGSLLVGVSAELLGARLAAIVPGIGLIAAAGALARWTPLWRLVRDGAGALRVS